MFASLNALRAATARTARPFGLKGGAPALVPRFSHGRPHWKKWDPDRALRGYEASSWVYSCVQKLATGAASVPWVVRRNGEVDPHHPLTLLLAHPNAQMGRQRVIETVFAHLYLTGNAILCKVLVGPRGSQVPAELWPIVPSKVEVIADRTKLISGYKLPEEKTPRPAGEVVHLMLVNPADMLWGMGRLQAVAKAVDTDLEAVEFNKVSLQERLVTDGVLSFKQSLTRPQFEEYREFLKEQREEGGRAPLILGSDADWHQMSLTPAEMDFMASRRFTMEEICIAFGLDPALFQPTTFRNKEHARRAMWEDTLIPDLERVQSAFERSLLPHFGDPEELELVFDLSGVPALRQVFAGKVKSFVSLVGAGVPPRIASDKLEMDLP